MIPNKDGKRDTKRIEVQFGRNVVRTMKRKGRKELPLTQPLSAKTRSILCQKHSEKEVSTALEWNLNKNEFGVIADKIELP